MAFLNVGTVRLLETQPLTIATGVITPTRATVILTSETGVVDDLTTIARSGFIQLADGADDYRPLVILQAATGHTITVKHNTSLINLNSGADFTLSGMKQLLLYDRDGTVWGDVSGGGIGGSSLPVSDATAIVQGSVDATKQLRFEVDGFTTATTRVMTPPNYDGTIATLAGAESLSAKTLVTPTIADYTNAAHSHTNAAGGGTLTDTALSAPVGIGKGGTGQTTQTAAMDALSPTTTKGDLLVDNGTSVVRLPIGITTGHGLTVDPAEATGMKWAAVAGTSFQYFIIADQKAQGTAGGGSTGGNVWTTHDLQTEIVDASNLVTIASNKFTPISGTYEVKITTTLVAASAALEGRIRLRNVTAATVVSTPSINLYMNAGGDTPTPALTLAFVANGTDEYDVQYQIQTGKATDGLGVASNVAGETEVYMLVYGRKVA